MATGSYQNSSGGSKTFYYIINGKITTKVTPDTPNAVKRINKNSEEVFELNYDFIEGNLIDFRVRKNEKTGSNEYVFTFDDVGVKSILTIGVESSYAENIVRRFYGLTPNKLLTFVPYSFRDKAKSEAKGKDIFIRGVNILNGDHTSKDKIVAGKFNIADYPSNGTERGKKVWKLDLEEIQQAEAQKLQSLFEASGASLPASVIDTPVEQNQQEDDLPF